MQSKNKYILQDIQGIREQEKCVWCILLAPATAILYPHLQGKAASREMETTLFWQ